MTKITSVSKRVLSLLMALLMLCSGMVAANAAEGDITVPEIKWTLDAAKKTITVEKMANVDVESVGYPVTITINPAADEATTTVEGKDAILYYNLAAGTTYTLTAQITVAGQAYQSTASVPLKNAQSTPSTPKLEEHTSSKIVVAAVSGCEYRLETASGKVATSVDGSVTYDWGSTRTFSNLAAETTYVVLVRVKETDKAYASDAAKVTVKTLKTNTEVADAPVLADKTMNTIKVNEVEDVEFSIDAGKTWQASGEFKNLKKATEYTIIARNVYDAATEDKSPVSAALKVKTNSRESYVADINSCKFTADDGDHYADESLSFSVTGAAPANVYDLQYGDTKLTPANFSIDGGENLLKFTGKDGSALTASFVPGEENAEKKMTITVYFAKEKYNGSSWETVETVAKDYTVEIGVVNDIGNKILTFFQAIINFFLNTLPGFINGLITGEHI